jgi:hypothetical protein
MIVIPELQKVVIMPPRSGSTALKAALLGTYPLAYAPYRHGEWMMVNHLRDSSVARTYTAVYPLRDPLQRMISLWRYMQDVSPQRNPRAPQEWIDRVRADASRTFTHWLHTSNELFNESRASPNDGSPESYYCTWFSVPAARKDARYFLQDCPAFEMLRFGDVRDYKSMLGIEIPALDNASTFRDAVVSHRDTAFIEEHHHTDMILMGTK